MNTGPNLPRPRRSLYDETTITMIRFHISSFKITLYLLLLFCSVHVTASAQQAPYFSWVKGLQAYHNTSYIASNWGNAIKKDPKGNVVIAGMFVRSVDFDPSSQGVDSQSSPNNYGCYFAKYDSLGNHLFAKTIRNAQGLGLAIDDSGYIYVGGHFYDTADFDPGPLKTTLVSKGDHDFFVAKYTANGELKWVRGSGGSQGDEISGVALDKQGNVYVGGSIHGSPVDFNERNPGSVTYYTSVRDGFIAKYDRNGNYVWSRQLKGNDGDLCRNVVIDSTGNLYACGYSSSGLDFGSGTSATANGFYDAFLAKYNTNGNLLWSKLIGGPGFDMGFNMAIDKSGSILFGGSFTGSAVFDASNPNGTINSSHSQEDAFISKFSSNGTFAWAKGFGSGAGIDLCNAVAVDDSMNVYIGGYFYDTVRLNGSAVVGTHVAVHQSDMYLAKLKGNGDYVWSKSFGATGPDEIRDIYLDKRYNIYYTGYIARTTVFEPGNTNGSVVIVNPNPNNAQNTIFGKYAQIKPAPTSIHTAQRGNLSLAAYPNPVTSRLTITGFKPDTQIPPFITDLAGRRQACAYEFAADHIDMQIQSLVPGIYFVRCTDQNGNTGLVRILKTD